MKKFFTTLTIGLILTATSAFAFDVNLYVDAAPNVYGSPDYAPWLSANYSAATSGTYVNMLSSVNPANSGTTNFEIQDEVVYSFGDLGKRLTWTYWIPGTTINALKDNFKISLTNIWGNDDPWDFYNYYYGSTWLEPTKWENYNDGVIGAAGMAWWGAYQINTEEALVADLAEWGSVSESWIFSAQLDGQEYSLTSHRDAVAPVPEPSTILLLGSGLAGLAFYGRKRK